MIRKLIQISPSTRVISLPSVWITKNKLTKGSELCLEESENKIIISTTNAKTLPEFTIDFGPLSEKLCWTYLDAAYVAGYDTICIRLHSKIHSKIIVNATNEVPGMLLVEHTDTKAVFKDITHNALEDITLIVARIFNMLISLVDELSESMSKKDWATLLHVKKKDYMINAYVSYAQRQINKFGYTTFSKSGVMITILKLLEIVADEICEDCLLAVKNKQSISYVALADTLQALRKVHNSCTDKTISQLVVTSTKIHSEIIRGLCNDLIELEVQLHL